MSTYYLRQGQETRGPYRLEEIQAYWQQARISAATLYWDAATETWQPVGRLLLPDHPEDVCAPHQPEQKRPKKYRLALKRTWTVMWVCVIGFVYTIIMFLQMLRVRPDRLKENALLLVSGETVILFLSWMLIWRMYKLGVWLLIPVMGWFLYRAYHLHATVMWGHLGLLLGLFLAIMVTKAYRRMRWW